MVTPESTGEESRRRRRKLRLCTAAALLAVLACGALALHLRPERPAGELDRAGRIPPDPRLSYRGPFANVHPAVRYVGSAACTPCHPDIARVYAHHPMARTLMPIAELAPSQPYDTAHRNPFIAFASLFRVERQGERVWHRQIAPADSKPVYEFEAEVHYAIGSGSHGHSYLSNRNGYLFETPVSWFTQKQIWDQSPGFQRDTNPGRPISGGCLFCHSNRAQSFENQINRYASPIFPNGCGIGCERCHGPGEKHIANPGSMTRLFSGGDTQIDPTIVHPGKLKMIDSELSESICRQCHLTGEQRIVRHGRGLYDYRPGMPLDDFVSIFVAAGKAEEPWRAVSHFEQMYLSKCFQGSTGATKLGCISCHDPHEHIGPARRDTFYRQRCLACHADGGIPMAETTKIRAGGCSLPMAARAAKGNSRITCHMPPYIAADVLHNASTDHRVRAKPVENSLSAAAAPDTALLIHFPKGTADAKDGELRRDLGLALVGRTAPEARQAIVLLEAALQKDPDDIDAWEKKGMALVMIGRREEALAAFQTALAKDPRRELSLSMAATAASCVGEREIAATYFRRARDLNPWNPAYRAGLAELYAEQGAWADAAQECRAWLQSQPGSVAARKLWVRCLLHQREEREARTQLGKIGLLAPQEREQIETWFCAELRASKARR